MSRAMGCACSARRSITCQEFHSGELSEKSMNGKQTADQKGMPPSSGCDFASRRRRLCMASEAWRKGPRWSGSALRP